MRTAALLGIAEGPGLVAVVGPGTASVDFLAELSPSVECVAVHRTLAPAGAGVSPATHVIVGDVLPFMPATFRGVAVFGPVCAAERCPELLNLLVRGGRLLVEEPTPAWQEAVAGSGADPLLDAPEALVLGKT